MCPGGSVVNDFIEEFKAAMWEHGIEPPERIIDDGVLHRFNINRKASGWYVLHGGGFYAGAFGDWSKDIKAKWHQDSDKKYAMSNEEKQRMEAAKNRREQGRRRLQICAANRACDILDVWARPVKSHAYAEKKRVNIAKIGLSVYQKKLVIPIVDSISRLVNLQLIDKDGTKKFLYGGKIKGCYHEIGQMYGYKEKLFICEGWATGMSLHHHFGEPVIVAFSAGNLTPVAVAINKLLPEAKIIIAADNDKSGVGEKAAIEACHAIGCTYIIPDDLGDFNDLFPMDFNPIN